MSPILKYNWLLFLPFLLGSIQIQKGHAQSLFPTYNDKETLEKDVQALILDFNQFMKEKGIHAKGLPSAEIKTTQALIYIDYNRKKIVLPWWKELFPEQKQLFEQWQGDKAEEFFTAMFNWFFIPHEFGHYVMLSDSVQGPSPYRQEWAANEFAVAYLYSSKENREKLEYIETTLKKVLAKLPPVDLQGMTDEAYFNKNYDGLGNDPNVYGFFQFRMILAILKEKDQIDISRYISSD
jgi:hypothetical protein